MWNVLSVAGRDVCKANCLPCAHPAKYAFVFGQVLCTQPNTNCFVGRSPKINEIVSHVADDWDRVLALL